MATTTTTTITTFINPSGMVIDGKPPKLPIGKCSSNMEVPAANVSSVLSNVLAGPVLTGNITASYSLNKFFHLIQIYHCFQESYK